MIRTSSLRTIPVLLLILLAGCGEDPGEEVDFTKEDGFKNVQARKKHFFSVLYPVVKAENERMLEQRESILEMLREKKAGGSLWGCEVEQLRSLSHTFRCDTVAPASVENLKALKRKVDLVPVELVLVQAANESSWGRSYFARKGNNLFGEWCFSKGCGIVPRQRSQGATHEVRKFSSVSGSVRSYLENLNAHPAYKQLRRIRARMREAGKKPKALRMAAGLSRYSSKGQEYVRLIRQMIRSNRKLIGKVKRPEA